MDGDYELNMRLQDAMGFGAADIEANRHGRISQAQRTRFVQQSNVVMVEALLMFVVAIIIALVMRMWFIIVIFLMIIIYLAWWDFRRRWLDFQDGVVHEARGVARLETYDGSHGSVNYRVRIGGQAFEDCELVCRAFQDGVHYCVYYLPRSKRLVSGHVDLSETV